MPKTIALTRGEQYRKHGYTFERNQPQIVDDNAADDLLGTGFFTDFPNEGLDAFGLERSPTPLIPPKNTIDSLNEDLNGKRVLLRRFGAIGDVVFVLAAAQYIKECFPACHLTLAVQYDQIAFVSIADCLDAVIDVGDSNKADVIYSYDYLLTFNGCIESVQPDQTDYFELHWRRIGTLPRPKTLPLLQITRILSQLITQREANTVLRTAGIEEGEDYVVLVLGTGHPLKRLPKETLQTIVDRLSSGSNVALDTERTSRNMRAKRISSSSKRIKVLCIGDIRDRVVESNTQWTSVAVGQSLAVSAELVRRSRLVIGADTGFVHLAAAIGAPTVSIWGPTNPIYTMPNYAAPKRCVFAASEEQAKLPEELAETMRGCTAYSDTQHCSPCNRLRTTHCQFYQGSYADCMRKTPVDTVLDSVYALLEAEKTHPAREVKKTQITSTGGDFVPPLFDTRKNNIAVLLDVSDQYTGGGFYVWSLVKAFAALENTHVHVFHDRPTVAYAANDPDLGNVRLVYHENLQRWDGMGMDFNIVVAPPPNLGKTAVEYTAAHPATKSILLVYETPNYIAEYRKGIDAQEEYWNEYRDALLRASSVFCISDLVREKLLEWCPAMAINDPTRVVYPSAYDSIADERVTDAVFRAPYREEQVVLIARNESYKGVRTAISTIAECFAMPTKRRLKVIVIGQAVTKLKKHLRDEWRLKGIDIVLKESVTEDEKWRILLQSKALIHPSEFEGFGITLLEAGLAGTPIICRPLEVFQQCFPEVQEHFYTGEASLVEALDAVFKDWSDMKNGKDVDLPYDLKRRRAFLKENYSARKQTKAVSGALKALGIAAPARKHAAVPISVEGSDKTKVAVISTWNTRCGIAETTQAYLAESRCLYRVFAPDTVKPDLIHDDGNEVLRCWVKPLMRDAVAGLVSELIAFHPDVAHIHHEFSFFQDDAAFFSLVDQLRGAGIKVVVTLHTYLASAFTDALEKRVDVIVLAKEQRDLSPLYRTIGLPCLDVAPRSKREMKVQFGLNPDGFVVGTFGFYVEHKGFKELTEAYNDIALKCGGATQMYIVGSHPRKSQYASEMRRGCLPLITDRKVVLSPDFLPSTDDVLDRLSACDVLVFNYNVIAYASASAAIRTGMSAGRPIVCTHSPMFSEFADGTHVLKVPFGDRSALADAIYKIKEDHTLQGKLITACTKYIQSCSTENIARSYDALYTELARVETRETVNA